MVNAATAPERSPHRVTLGGGPEEPQREHHRTRGQRARHRLDEGARRVVGGAEPLRLQGGVELVARGEQRAEATCLGGHERHQEERAEREEGGQRQQPAAPRRPTPSRPAAPPGAGPPGPGRPPAGRSGRGAARAARAGWPRSRRSRPGLPRRPGCGRSGRPTAPRASSRGRPRRSAGTGGAGRAPRRPPRGHTPARGAPPPRRGSGSMSSSHGVSGSSAAAERTTAAITNAAALVVRPGSVAEPVAGSVAGPVAPSPTGDGARSRARAQRGNAVTTAGARSLGGVRVPAGGAGAGDAGCRSIVLPDVLSGVRVSCILSARSRPAPPWTIPGRPPPVHD